MIKALYDYKAPTDPPHYLSFSAGDFLHVVGRENDQDWYEACNPLHGSRGLVPVKYFDIVGKTVRDSRGSGNSANSAPHDSGYSSNPIISAPMNFQHTNGHGPMSNAAALGHRSSKSLGRLGMPGPGTPMVYGVVAYDFHTERPDELEAKEGEAIIVIAQSNPEWFVAKPITRLGGPGLIPVSFIEIKDMHTGQTVKDPSEAVQRAGIPRVEEWKKMAADYKNTSIPLGAFGSPTETAPRPPTAGLQHGMERLSMGGASPNTNGQPRIPSGYGYPPGHQVQAPPGMLPAIRASVPRVLYADEKFHYVVECILANGTHWVLSRKYEDFYELQINLIKTFPIEAGQAGQERILPFMPGPVQFVTDKISEGRRENLDEYLRSLLQLGSHITKSALVCGFFAPRGSDYDLDPDEAQARGHAGSQAPRRYSHLSQGSGGQHTPQLGYGSTAHQRQLSSTQAFSHNQRQQSPSRSTSSRGQPHNRSPSDFAHQQPPPMQRQMTQASTASGGNLKVKVWFDRETCVVVRMPPKGQFQYTDLYHKIVERRKLEYSGKKDSGVDGGVDGQGSSSASMAQDEHGNGNGGDDDDNNNNNDTPQLEVEYRDERDGEYYRLADDDELGQALESNEKLTLVVREIEA